MRRRTRTNRLVGSRGSGGVLVALLAALVLLPANAFAQTDDVLPPEIVGLYADCPPDSAFPDGEQLAFCLVARVYDGDVKLGDTRAAFDGPIKATVGIALGSNGEIIIVPGGDGDGGGSAASEMKVPGGLLGIPELDPILDPLGVFTVTATPQLGEVNAELGELSGLNDLALIHLPLSIKLNNAFFGPDCSIGTPDNPFEVNLTTGTTEPPAGVEPISGRTGELQRADVFFGYGTSGTNQADSQRRLGARNVDNLFALPGANDCDTLAGFGFGGTPLASLVNLDSLINSQVGLPAPAGHNHMMVSVDTATADREMVEAIRGDFVPAFVAWPLKFGDVAIGTSSETETLTVRNPRPEPFAIPATAGLDGVGSPGDFEVVSDGCVGQTLDQDETCEIEVRFSPTAEGTRVAFYAGNVSVFDPRRIAELRGTGIQP